MNKYYIKFGISKNMNAGQKAIKDTMYLLELNGYKPILSLPTHINKLIKLLDIPVLLFTIFFKVRKDGIIIYIVPSNHFRIKLLCFFKRIIGYKLICFIYDIDSLRMKKSEKFHRTEMNAISCADIALAPNDNSINILCNKYGFTNPLIPIGVWDYLKKDTQDHSTPVSSTTIHDNYVAFAGNLNKAPFINDLHLINLDFKVWGNSKEEINGGNIVSMGEKNPDELINDIAKCAWGLVWDGNSIETYAGSFGSYLRFNNSHKCGLYLAAKIPIIVWKDGGMAQLVNKRKIGICVSSLQEAADQINHMNKEIYNMYRKNAELISQDVREGKFFLNALDKAEKMRI